MLSLHEVVAILPVYHEKFGVGFDALADDNGVGVPDRKGSLYAPGEVNTKVNHGLQVGEKHSVLFGRYEFGSFEGFLNAIFDYFEVVDVRPFSRYPFLEDVHSLPAVFGLLAPLLEGRPSCYDDLELLVHLWRVFCPSVCFSKHILINMI